MSDTQGKNYPSEKHTLECENIKKLSVVGQAVCIKCLFEEGYNLVYKDEAGKMYGIWLPPADIT